MIVCVDGAFIDDGEAAVPIDDRGLLFGDGVFETAILRDAGFFRLREHLDRFAASAAMLRLPHPPLYEIERIARRLASTNRIVDGNLRVTLTRGVRTPRLIVTLRPPDRAAIERAARGWRIVTASTRRPSIAAVPAQLKALGRTWAILARLEASDAGVDDALLLTDHGHVCEGPSWNIFWRRGSTLFTPAPDAGVLRGVTRAAVIDLAHAAGFNIEEGLFPRSGLLDAHEVFATMTSSGLVSIRAVDTHEFDDDAAVRRLKPLYFDRLAAEVAADAAADRIE
jgi:branched-chain amino acid aminotransferase